MPKFQFSGWGGGGVFSTGQNRKVIKCQEMPKFQFGGGGGYSPLVKIEVIKCQEIPNSNFQRGGVFSTGQN